MGKPKAKTTTGKKPAAVAAPSTGQLTKLQRKVAELRDTEAASELLEARVSALHVRIREIETVELPELMLEAGVDKIGLPAYGDYPAYDAKMAAFYKANIAASWEPERRNQAFAYLTKIGAGDLIKTDIVISIPRDQRAEAEKLIARLERFNPVVKEAVHTGTLGSWLKEQSMAGKTIELDTIGGEVGTIVKIKPRKQEQE